MGRWRHFEDAEAEPEAMPRMWSVYVGEQLVGFVMISDLGEDLVGPYYKPADFSPEAIGLLRGAPETETWLNQVNVRFHFLADATEEEAQLQLCDPRDSYEVSQLIKSPAG